MWWIIILLIILGLYKYYEPNIVRAGGNIVLWYNHYTDKLIERRFRILL